MACVPSQVSKSALDKALTPERVSAIWRFAKAHYIDKGASYEATLSGVASDVGLPREFVARAFTKPKGLRAVTNQAYATQQARRDTIRKAEIHVATIDSSKAYRALVVATSIPRTVLTFGHGPVFPVTHSLDLAFTNWSAYFGSVKDSWRFMSKGAHGDAMDWLRSHELFVTARRAGLEIDPEKGPSGILIGGASSWSRRAWDALKISRIRIFEERWNDLAPDQRTPEVGKMLASQINHSTGVMSSDEWDFGGISRGMFAPQLTASKIAKTFIDPAKTIGTWSKLALGQEVPLEDRIGASLRTRQAGKFLAAYAGLLAINQGFNIATGQKDRINFTNPVQSDWLRPKTFGHTLNTRGTMELVRVVGQLTAISQATPQGLRGETRIAAARDAVARYAQYKAAPLVGLTAEAAFGEDAFGRPLPWNSNRGTPSHPKYTVPEFIASQGPIYLGGATRELYDEMRQQGLSASDTTGLLRAAMNDPSLITDPLVVGAMEFIGGGISKASQPRQSGGVSQPMIPAF